MLGINSRPPMLSAPSGVPLLRRETLLGRALQNVVLPGVQVMDLGERVFASSGAASGTLKPGPTGPARNYTGFPAANQIVPVRGASAYPIVQAWVGRFNASGSGPKSVRMVRSLTGGSGDYFEFTYWTSTQVGHTVRNNFGTSGSAVTTVPGGASLNVDLTIVAQILSATDHRIYCNGAMGTDTTNVGTPGSPFNQMWLCSSTGNNDHDTYLAAFGAGVALPDAYALELSRTPAKLFGELLQYPRRRIWNPIPTASLTWTAGGDVIVGGWSPNVGSNLWSCVDDPVLNRLDWITSPDYTTSCAMSWASSAPAGSYSVQLDAQYLGVSGQIRIVFLDAGGASVGETAWQVLTGSAATYTLSATTSATSTQFRLEIQP